MLNRTYDERMNDYELLRIIRLVEAVGSSFEDKIPFADPDPTWHIVLTLMKGHIRGQVVTISALATIKGVSRTTAMRKIHHLVEQGYIVRSARTKTLKSFELHPDKRLIDYFLTYARDVKSVLAKVFAGNQGDDDVDEHYFGGTNFASTVLPPKTLFDHQRHGQGKLRFLLHQDNYFEAMRNLWTDIRINLSSRKHFRLLHLPQLRRALFENRELEQSAFDLVVLNMPWLGEAVAKDVIRPLDDLLKNQSAIDAEEFDRLVWQSGRWGNKQYGIPLYCTVEVLAIRRDLLMEEGVVAPQTMEQTLDVARRLNQPAVGRYGILWNAAVGAPLASTFMNMLGSCGSSILNVPRTRLSFAADALSGEQLRPVIDSDSGREVMDYMHRLMEYSPPEILTVDSDAGIEGFMTGRSAMIYCWTMRAARFEYDIKSVVKRRVQYLPPPRGSQGVTVSSLGGFLLAIPTNLEDHRAMLAMKAISWMASPEALGRTVRNGFPIAPGFSVSADPEAAAGSTITSAVDALAKQGILQLWQRPAVPEFGSLETVLGTTVHRALSGEITDDQALADAQNAIDRIMRNAGHY